MTNLKHTISIILSIVLLFGCFSASPLEKRSGKDVIYLNFLDEEDGVAGVTDNYGFEDGTSDSPGNHEIDPNNEADINTMWDGNNIGDRGNRDQHSNNVGSGAGKSQSEEEKFNDFLIRSQREIINETREFESKLSTTLIDLTANLSSTATFTGLSEESVEDAHKAFDVLANTETDQNNGYLDTLTGVTKLEQAAYISDQKEKLELVRKQLLSKVPRSPQQTNAKFAGLQSLKYSDMSYNQGQNDQGDFYFEAAKQLASIVADFIPVTSVAKDVYGLVVGKDVFTGEQLSVFERTLCGTFALAQIAGSLYTAGMGASFVAAGIKQIRNITKAEANAVRLSVKLAKIAEKVPQRVSIALAGQGKGVALIGRNMNQVRAMKVELEKENVIVEIFDGPVISEKANEAWRNAVQNAKAYGVKIPDYDIIKMDIFRENKEWIEKMIKEGHTVLDAGKRADEEWSIFYEMERIVVERMKKAGVK